MLRSESLRQIQAVLVRVDGDHGRPEKRGKVSHAQTHRSHPEYAHHNSFAQPPCLLKPVMDAGYPVPDQGAILKADVVRQGKTSPVLDGRKLGVAAVLLETDVVAVKRTGNSCTDLAQLALTASRRAVNGQAISLSKSRLLSGFHHGASKFVLRRAG